ncbi:Glycosyltransferase family 28 C-terminal domain-containing protein [Caloramator quimbayensis]|uniref:Glycosyltransferase family 28 C-terminal domain-containing protein n=2 Tax=Caloramator quimbayensis TaxID=1147123 RepID=A0A1T4Y1N0_9CLOT|nr:Glycosyltransferase family 28 C-terminal domain-containing protein [Caloramator quimbayensis]
MNKKILIVYEKMGMGHLRMANILEEMLKTEGEVEVIKCAGSELADSSDVDFIVYLWNALIRKNLIKTADILINFIIRILGVPIIEAINTKDFIYKLEEINPDIIICTADGYNKVLGTYSREKKIPFYIMITEVSVFLDLVNPYAVHICYFNETGEAIRNYDFNSTYFSYNINKKSTILERIQYVLKFYKEYILLAYKNSIYRNADKYLERNNDAKYEVIGPLAEKKHFQEKDIYKIKNELGIPKEMDTVLIVSGSIGGRFLFEITDIICKKYDKPLNVLVMCGKDKKVYEKIKRYKNYNKNINIMYFGYTDRFDEFIAASDCIIARASAGIFIESVLNRTPEITFRRVTSNDRGAITMIEKYGLGEVCDEDNEILDKLNNILQNKEMYKNNIDRLLLRYSNTYEDKKKLIRSIIIEGNSSMIDDDGEIESEPLSETLV